MLFLIIAVVLIAFSYEPPRDLAQLTGPGVASLACVVSVALNWLAGEIFARWVARRLRGPFEVRAAAMDKYQRLRWLHAGIILGGYTGLIHGFDWAGVIRESWGLGRWILVDDLLVLAPAIVSLLLSATSHFRVEELCRVELEFPLVHPPQWRSRWSHVDFHLRHHVGIVLVPLLVLVGIQDIVALIFEGSPLRSTVELIAAIAGIVCVLVFAPLFLRVLWRAEPLPAGALRSRLELLSRRLKFRSSDILIWNTHGAVTNAAVAGILPWPRYVLLSDALLMHLNSDEVEAVFGHEVGHVRHHHLWFFVAFLKGAMLFLIMALGALTPLAEAVMGERAATQIFSMAQGLILPATCLALYFGVFFGFLSRRFERQADIFGCRAVSRDSAATVVAPAAVAPVRGDPPLRREGIQIFVQALEKIAALNGAIRDARSWRHFSIAKRVEFLNRIADHPEVERSFQRVVFLLKLLVIVTLGAAAWYVWQRAPESAQQMLTR
jgi:STE24 endopeptidase